MLVVGLFLYWRGSRAPRGAGGSPATSSFSAASTAPLLEGLTEGSTLGEWKVVRIGSDLAPNQAPQFAIDFERKGSFVSVYVGRKEAVQMPPITTERYGISHGHLRPEGEPIPPGSAEQLANQIADRVRRTEKTAPVPAGL